VHYGVFGLGNKQYEHFNAVGKRMHKNMEALGATAVCPRGDGDDDDNIGEVQAGYAGCEFVGYCSCGTAHTAQ
jgi:sulfite reductase alpha subunit-like flavoprotein